MDVFGALWRGNGIGYTWPDDITFEQVLNLNGNQDQYQFGAHVVAAYLNAMEIEGYGQTPQDVIRITSEIIDTGVYEIPEPTVLRSTQKVTLILYNKPSIRRVFASEYH